MANDLKNAVGMDGDNDDMNAAASAAAEAVMNNKQSLKDAALDLVDKMNSIKSGSYEKPE
jgi:hypothetical protein